MKTNPDYKSRFRILKGGKIALVISTLLGTMTILSAAPSVPIIRTGSISVSEVGNTTTVTQSTQRASMTWESFSIAPTETVNFVQPSSSSIILNRVVGAASSLIEGTINANGQVFLLNPNGIVFSSGSSVNVGGLVASTLNMNDEDFQNGSYPLSGSSTNSVLNLGTITANSGGYIVLAGKTVSNEGLISATLGNVQLAGASNVTLNINGSSLIKLTIDQGVLNALVENKGVIQADGGVVYLTTQALNTVLNGVVNNTGIIEADSLSSVNGEIFLLASGGTTNVDGTLSAIDGNIRLSGKVVNLAGTAVINADTLTMTPDNILIDPSGGSDLGGTGISATAIENALTTTDVMLYANKDITINQDIIWADPTKLTLDAGAKIYLNAIIENTNNSTGGVYFHAVNRTDAVVFDPTSGKVIVNNVFQLQWINQALNGKYELGSNIDASATATWGGGFTPIGNDTTLFRGNFDGLGYTISNLFINRLSTSNVGLFGYVGSGATVKNVGLINVDITGKGYVGGLIGTNFNASLENVYVTGNVRGYSNYVGGLIGSSDGSDLNNAYFIGDVKGHSYVGGLIGEYSSGGDAYLRDSYAIGTVSSLFLGAHYVGGLVGWNGGFLERTYADVKVTGPLTGSSGDLLSTDFGGLVGQNLGSIVNSYATGDVSGAYDNVGGLVGFANGGIISNSYATGDVIGLKNNAGGLVGYGLISLIEKSYATGDVTGNNNVGGLIGESNDWVDSSYATGRVSGASNTGGFIGGKNDGSSGAAISNSYWDIDSTGQTVGNSAIHLAGESLDGIKSMDAFTQATYNNLDFANDWYMIDGETRPFLRMEYSTNIINDHQLQLMVMDLSADYTLSRSITYNADMWSIKGFSPIGNSSNLFTGNFDGLGHTISNLAINKENSDNVGLFGVTDVASTVQNVGLLNVEITAHNNVGAVVGKNLGILKDTYVTGSISGNANVGGVAGYNDGSVSTSYSIATVAGNTLIGELVGNNNAGSITNSYSDINAFDEASFAGFDFTNTWFMVDGYTRPFLRGEYSTYITTDHELQLMSMDLSAGYILANDIIYSGDMWSVKGFSTIGESTNKFKGSLNGNGYLISNLFINNAGNDYVGVFGATDVSSSLKNFTLKHVDITGRNYVGALAGSNGGSVKNVFVMGEVNGVDSTGGLVGENSGSVANSYNSGTVNGHDNTGGLVGKNTGNIANTYSTASVNANSQVGGLIGSNNGSVRTSYAIGKVSGSSKVGGFAGENAGTFTDTLWDVDTTGLVNGVGSGGTSGTTGIYSSTSRSAFATSVYGGFSFNDGSYQGLSPITGNWFMIAGNTRPFLTSEYSNTITNDHQLQLISLHKIGGFILANDIVYTGDMWNSAGFVPVAPRDFDGRGYTISDLFINRPTTDFVGLFESYGTGTIRNVGLINVDITGKDNVGGIMGSLWGDIRNSYVTGSIKGNNNVGGLVGHLIGVSGYNTTLSNSYSSADVSGNTNVGGLVGWSDYIDSYIFNSYATGKVTGNTNVGAIIGLNEGRIYNTYWDIDTSGVETAIGSGGLGGTIGIHSSTGTIDAFSASTYAGSPEPIVRSEGLLREITIDPSFDFTNTWILYDGYTRPLLRTFMTNLTVTANDATKTYDGTAYAGENGVLYSLRPNSNLLGTLDYGDNTDAGSYVFRASGLYSNQQGYAISYVDGRLTIDPKTITADYLADNKVYDGTTTAVVTGSSSDMISGDILTFTNTTANFDNKNVGTGKMVYVDGITIGGVDSGNYILANTTSTATASVTPKTLTGIFVADNKLYDGTTTTNATLIGSLSGIIGGDIVNFSQADANFDNKNAGTSKTVTINSALLSGTDASNYVVSSTTTADITPKVLIASYTANNKMFDGTTRAIVNGSSSDIINGDRVSFLQVANFEDRNVGTEKRVNINSISLGGVDGGNYTLLNTSATALADITDNQVIQQIKTPVKNGTAFRIDDIKPQNLVSITQPIEIENKGMKLPAGLLNNEL